MKEININAEIENNPNLCISYRNGEICIYDMSEEDFNKFKKVSSYFDKNGKTEWIICGGITIFKHN